MKNPKLKWQWPANRALQIFLVFYTLMLLVPVYMLIGMFFAGERVRYPSPLILWIPILAAVTGLVIGILAIQRKSRLILGWSFMCWSIVFRHVPGYLPVERRFLLEVLRPLMLGAAIVAWGLATLRGEWSKTMRGEQPE